jgi:hypothetical protein
MKKTGPKILIYDIETAPIIAQVWDIWEQNVGLSQIQSDWHVIAFAAKWLGDSPSKIIYKDQRHSKNIENDKILLKQIWTLLDSCDIAITQNGVAFDNKKLNARFIQAGFPPPSSFKNIDTKLIASRYFKFTSNKLEYLSNTLNEKYKKLNHSEFSGHSLWTECLKGNLKAWKAMERYNKHDVLATEELWTKLSPWANNAPNFNIYHNDYHHICRCGSKDLNRNGYAYTTTGKYIRYKCKDCGVESRDPKNILTKEKRDSLKRKV